MALDLDPHGSVCIWAYSMYTVRVYTMYSISTYTVLRMHVRMELFETEALHAIIGHIVALQI